MVRAGVKEIFIALGYRSKDIVDSLGQGEGFGAHIIYAYEDVPMGTVGAVKLLQDQLDDTFLVGSGDTLTDADFSSLIDLHFKSGSIATMGLTEVQHPEQFGIVGTSAVGRIERFKEKPTTEEAFSNVINAGTYVLHKEVLDHVPKNQKYDFSKNLFPDLLAQGKPLYACKLQGYWKDIGRPEDLLEANLRMADIQGEPTFLPGMVTEGNILASEVGGEGAEIIGPSFLDRNVTLNSGVMVRSSCLGRNVFLGEGAQIKNSLILEGCRIGPSASLDNVILGRNCLIGPGISLVDSVMGDEVKIEGPESLEASTRLMPGRKS
jgi:mannose-1-phosphate guanylyltransferase